MSVETHGFLRVLPDSTGKRLPMIGMVEVDYNNGTIPFVTGDIITTGTSNIIMTVYEVEGTTSSGLLHCKIEEPVPANIVFTVGENFVVDAVTRAKAASTGNPFYYPINTISGYRNPINGWDIASNGAGLVSFPDGAPTFDVFGKMLTAAQTTIAEYLSKYSMDISKMNNLTVGNASATHDPSSSGIVLFTGSASGDTVERISNQYHPYQLSRGRLVEITCACGDSGKTNLTRYWGYGDEDDGVFFTLVNTTFYVQLRSSVTGSITYTNIPQSEWNIDRLDGTNSVFNRSGMLLDLTKSNMYWIDFQWNIGVIRFGVFNQNGDRLLCHRIENANQNNSSFMRTGSLPVYFEQKNTGFVGSSSEFRVWCAAVKQGGEFLPQKTIYSLPTVTKTLTDTNVTPIVSIRAKQLMGAITNRVSSFIESIATVSTSGMVEFNIYDNTILSGASFVETAKAVEYDTSSTAVSGGTLISTFFVQSGGEKSVNTSNLFNFLAHSVRRLADSTADPHVVTITAKLVSAGSSEVRVSATISDV